LVCNSMALTGQYISDQKHLLNVSNCSIVWRWKNILFTNVKWLDDESCALFVWYEHFIFKASRSWIRVSCYNYGNKQQDALYRLIYYFKLALRVSGDVFAHYQEHLTVFTVSGSVHPSCCRLVSRMSWNWTMWIVRHSRHTIHIVQNSPR